MRPLNAFRNLVRFGLSIGHRPLIPISVSAAVTAIAAVPVATITVFAALFAARPAAKLLGPLLRCHRIVGQDLALEHPDFDTAGAIGGLGRARAVIDIGTQRMQRHAAFAIPLHARDFGAAETAGAVDPNAACAQTHRRLHRALHGTAEGDATLELLGDPVGDQLGIKLRLADLDDVQADLAAGHLADIQAQLFDIRALLAD